MKRFVILIVGCLVIVDGGCSIRTTQVETENRRDQFRAIVHLKTRNEVTTVMSGPNGLAYTVRAGDGSILEEQISELELLTKFPTIYRLMKTSYAGGKDRRAWAGGNH